MAKVMIVDDEASWRRLCSERLTQMGHDVTATGNCADAVRQMKTDPPDLVVLDLRMPVSGRSMLQAIQQEHPEVPVVIHTVYSGYKDDPGLNQGGRFAVKSPELKELTAQVKDVLGQSKPVAGKGNSRRPSGN